VVVVSDEFLSSNIPGKSKRIATTK